MFIVVIHPGDVCWYHQCVGFFQTEDVEQAQHVYAISMESSWELLKGCRVCHPVSTEGKELDSERKRDKSQQSASGQDPVVRGDI